jgi:filamentous hemagglutinin
VLRVQGGNHPNPNKRSKFLIAIDEGNNPNISRSDRLNISIGDDAHVDHFLTQRPGGEVVSFEIPKWMDDFIEESSLPQFKASSNPLYDKATTPLRNDPTTPGRSFELPPMWSEWLVKLIDETPEQPTRLRI